MTSQTSELVARLSSFAHYLEEGWVVTAGPRSDRLDPADLRTAIALLERLSSSEVTEEEVERVARAIGDRERQQCGGYPYTGADPAFDPWLTDKHRAFARAAITAMRSAATSERKG